MHEYSFDVKYLKNVLVIKQSVMNATYFRSAVVSSSIKFISIQTDFLANIYNRYSPPVRVRTTFCSDVTIHTLRYCIKPQWGLHDVSSENSEMLIIGSWQ